MRQKRISKEKMRFHDGLESDDRTSEYTRPTRCEDAATLDCGKMRHAHTSRGKRADARTFLRGEHGATVCGRIAALTRRGGERAGARSLPREESGRANGEG